VSTSTTNYGYVKPAAGEAFSRSTYNTTLDDIDGDIKDREKQALGQVAIGSVTANNGPFGSKTVITFIASYTFKANRKYRIAAEGNYFMSGTSSTAQFVIHTCSTADSSSSVAGLTALKSSTQRPNVSSEGRDFHVARDGVTYGTDTTLQIKLTAERLSGADGLTTQASATDPITLVIYDMGNQ
jgi:hypothetical protein